MQGRVAGGKVQECLAGKRALLSWNGPHRFLMLKGFNLTGGMLLAQSDAEINCCPGMVHIAYWC